MVFILVWAVGDSAKTAYSVMIDAPIQLVISAAFQLLVDLLILGQICILGEGKKSAADQKNL